MSNNKGSGADSHSDASQQDQSKQPQKTTNSSITADVLPTHNVSKVWFIPIVAVLIGSWMVYQTWANQGPLITIFFETAEGISVDNTKIKLRDITIGQVVELKLNNKFDGIQITARLDKNTDELLTSDTQFWVVKPRVGNGGISGLSTLLSGAYIELSPGIDEELKYDFIGLENPPVTPSGTAGLHITLDSDTVSGLDIGDAIIFHGIKVGRVEFVHFNVDERKVYYDAFIESPYDKLVTTNTRFWKINGIEFDLSADGLQVRTGTLETFLGGGITFDVPANLPKGEIVNKRAFFTIYSDKADVLQKQFKNAQEFVLLFGQSIRGLKPGSPVEYKGVRIGTVLRTDIDYKNMGNFLSEKTRIPILIQIEPARVGMKDDLEEVVKVKEAITKMISSGMHGFISSGNILTGSKYIEIRYVTDTSNQSRFFNGYQVIPTAVSQIDNLLEKLDSILGTVDQLSLDEMVTNISESMAEFRGAMINFSRASEQVDNLLDSPDSEQLIASINQMLLGVEQLAKDFSDGSKTHQDIQNMIAAMESMLKELTPVLSQLNHQPNSLIFGGEKNNEVEPEGRIDD